MYEVEYAEEQVEEYVVDTGEIQEQKPITTPKTDDHSFDFGNDAMKSLLHLKWSALVLGQTIVSYVETGDIPEQLGFSPELVPTILSPTEPYWITKMNKGRGF